MRDLEEKFGRVSYMDLLINTLMEHEKKLDELADRFEEELDDLYDLKRELEKLLKQQKKKRMRRKQP